ncbi:MAG: MFS transporter [Micropepsaceae bacterium]
MSAAEPSAPSYHRQERTSRLSFSLKLFQGIGAIPDTIKNWVFNTFVLIYYNQILGVDALLVSVALALTIIIDAIADPWIGAISDNLHSKWGRRHPLMLLGAIPLGPAFYAVFVPPAGLSQHELFEWLTVFLILSRVSLSVFFVPWAAIAAELTDDYDERTSVMAYRYAVGWFVGVLFPLLVFAVLMPATPAYPVGQLNASYYPTMALVGAGLMTFGALATTFLTWKEIPYLRQHTVRQSLPSIGATIFEVRRALANREFALFFTIVLISSALAGTTQNMALYMATYFWQLASEDLKWFALWGIGALLAFPLVSVAQRWWDKKHILLVCSFLSMFGGVAVVTLRFEGVLPPNGSQLLIAILVVEGALIAGIEVIRGVIGASAIADILDQHELETGFRQEAMFNAAVSFCVKATSGLGMLFGGLILSFINLPEHADPASVPAASVRQLGSIVGVCLPLLHLVPIYMITQYGLTRLVHADIRKALDARKTRQSSVTEVSSQVTDPH